MSEPSLTPGKKSAQTKGPKVLKRAGRKAAGTLAIRREVAKALSEVRKAFKQLDAISARLELVRESLEAIQENSGPGKPPAPPRSA